MTIQEIEAIINLAKACALEACESRTDSGYWGYVKDRRAAEEMLRKLATDRDTK